MLDLARRFRSEKKFKMANFENPSGESLLFVEDGKDFIIESIIGGISIVQRLQSLGIREGQRVKKLSQMRFCGPVILLVDRAQIAIGYRMAKNILVKIANNE